MSWKRPSTSLCAFLTLLNDRLGESIVFPLLPFLLASFTDNGRTLGLLTLYDMVKAVDPAMTIGPVRLLSKTGGRRGDWQRDD